MNVLGITGRPREAAAALSVDGVLVAAVSEAAVSRGAAKGMAAGWPRAAVAACLASAGITPANLHRINIVDDAGAAWTGALPSDTAVVSHLDPIDADALQASATTAAPAVLVCSSHPPAMSLCVVADGQVRTLARVAGVEALYAAAATLALALGVSTEDPFHGLDRLSLGGEAEYQARFASVLQWRSTPPRIEVDVDALQTILVAVAASHNGQLANRASLNVVLQRARQALAATFICQVAAVVVEALEELRSHVPGVSLALGGGLFAHARLAAEVRARAGAGVTVTAVPESSGRALGAALAAVSTNGTTWRGLGLGPVFSEADIKHTLDNCRLDYVYEPDWSRLHARVSKMLAQGKVVAWFQGPLTFGARSFGSRSILCDPSGRYARHNVNEYLRQQPLDEPLPLVFAPSAAQKADEVRVRAFDVRDLAVPAEWHGALAAALDWRQHVRVHGVDAERSPELCQLLEVHYERTGTPALIETTLSGPDEPVACTPRDAVRTAYSSAVDALVVGRLLLMKDHWLLRTETV